MNILLVIYRETCVHIIVQGYMCTRCWWYVSKYLYNLSTKCEKVCIQFLVICEKVRIQFLVMYKVTYIHVVGYIQGNIMWRAARKHE
jgi:hypothetical protein